MRIKVDHVAEGFSLNSLKNTILRISPLCANSEKRRIYLIKIHQNVAWNIPRHFIFLRAPLHASGQTALET